MWGYNKGLVEIIDLMPFLNFANITEAFIVKVPLTVPT